MKNSDHNKLLIIGIGNDSRQDDGLGWALLDRIEKEYPGKFELVYKYQLNIEESDLIKEEDKVLFVDACMDVCENGCAIEKCSPNGDITFTTHALSPSAILALCQQVYERSPEAYVLKIQGYEWELKTGMTERAILNLDNAFNLFSEFAR